LRKTFQPIFDAAFYSTTGTEVEIVAHYFLSYSKVILQRFYATLNNVGIKVCLLYHRHSKTRMGAIEATHAILMSQLSHYIGGYVEAVENIPSDNKYLNAIYGAS